MKNKVQHLLVLAAAAAMVGFLTNNAAAQDDAARAERRQKMIDDYQETIGIKSQEDWKKVEPLVGKVVDAQRDARMGGGFGNFGRRGGGDQGNRNRFGTPNPEREALQKAIEDKAPADEIKAKLAKLREARKAKESALEKAQEELKKALSPSQEANAVLVGLLR